MKVKDWKLLRCIYDEMGQFAIEGEYCGLTDRFEESLSKDYGSVGWLIGKPIKHFGGVTVKVILEGEKEILEYVLELIRMQERVKAEAQLNQRKGVCALDSEPT